jgi:ADP-ribosylglycohydrolase
MNIKDFLKGTAIGDAFGAGVEFQDRNWIQEHVDFTTFVDARSRIQVPEDQQQAFVQNYQAWDGSITFLYDTFSEKMGRGI